MAIIATTTGLLKPPEFRYAAETAFSNSEKLYPKKRITRCFVFLGHQHAYGKLKSPALYSARRMNSRLSAKDEEISMSLAEESIKASFLRRKSIQGKAQFDKPHKPNP
jgi:hypothetical protein